MEQAQTELSWRERGRLWLRLGIRFLLIAAVVLGLVVRAVSMGLFAK